MKLKFVLGILVLFLSTSVRANAPFIIYTPMGVDTFKTPPANWFNLDPSSGVHGVSTENTYQMILKGKKSKTVVVAVIDSGIDIEHEDLKDIIWVNEDEVPNNGVDDDKNGYVDDVNGWNFIGGKDRTHVAKDNLEITRLYRKYSKQFEGKTAATIGNNEKAQFAEFQEIKKDFEKDFAESKAQFDQVNGMFQSYKTGMKAFEEHFGKKDFTADDIKNINTNENAELKESKDFFTSMFKRGFGIEDLAELEEYHNYLDAKVNYQLNVEFDPRSIVGDNYDDPTERGYGNNQVIGPDATHGTHVAGIIGAVRGNTVGMSGVADNVRIMVIRAVPDGDERDKDVANAIRYAADNGAQVINMSFGKGYSWNKGIVDEAVKYAESKDVLLVHAAGNSSLNLEKSNNFPNDTYEKGGKSPKTWIEVGALHWKENTVANFSNYGKEQVDLFAPGVDIYATTPNQGYEKLSGTSMAAPVVAGTAAVIRSYFPDLSAKDVKKVLLKSVVTKSSVKYNLPGSKEKKVSMAELCKTGGIVNVYKAVELASKISKGTKTANP